MSYQPPLHSGYDGLVYLPNNPSHYLLFSRVYAGWVDGIWIMFRHTHKDPGTILLLIGSLHFGIGPFSSRRGKSNLAINLPTI